MQDAHRIRHLARLRVVGLPEVREGHHGHHGLHLEPPRHLCAADRDARQGLRVGRDVERRVGEEQSAGAQAHEVHARGAPALEGGNDAQELAGRLGDGAYVKRGERQAAVNELSAAIDWFMNEARRGQTIQRYKGLGEMNPEQLWDTTVNPETRRLMQVKIEDAVKADEIFTTLMGDQVEPRREFIEKNALAVSNLDV